MKKLYLIRHGETELNKSKVYYGATDCSLNERGRRQAQDLALVFQNIAADLVYLSPLKRARETAAIIFAHSKIPQREDERLKEMDFGLWEGKHYLELAENDEYLAWQKDWQSTKTPGGESFEDLAARVKDFYLHLIKSREENIVVLCHNAVLTLLLTFLLGLEQEQCWHFHFQQGAYSLLEFSGEFGIIKKLN